MFHLVKFSWVILVFSGFFLLKRQSSILSLLIYFEIILLLLIFNYFILITFVADLSFIGLVLCYLIIGGLELSLGALLLFL